MRYVSALLLVAVVGCAHSAPSPRVQNAFCGSAEAYAAERERARENPVSAPWSGMTGCEVIARWGVPDEQTRVDVGSGLVLHWTYWMPDSWGNRKLNLITLEAGPQSRGVVRTVVWN